MSTTVNSSTIPVNSTTESTNTTVTTTITVNPSSAATSTVTQPAKDKFPDYTIPLAVTLGVVVLLIIITIIIVLIIRRRRTRAHKKPPMLPPPYVPSVPNSDTNQQHTPSLESVNADSLDQDTSFNENKMVRCPSTSSGYLEPTAWTEKQDPQDNHEHDLSCIGEHRVEQDSEHEVECNVDVMESFYIDMQAGDHTQVCSGYKNTLPHHELVYSENEIEATTPHDQMKTVNDGSAEILPPPCTGTTYKHGYVNVPETSPENTNAGYANISNKNHVSNYANLQQEGQHIEVKQKSDTLPKYSNIPMGKPDNIKLYTPKSSPKPKQVKKSKLANKMASASKTNVINCDNRTKSPRPNTAARSNGVGVVKVEPPQSLPKPSNSKQRVLPNANCSDSDDDNDEEYVNVPAKQCTPQYHGDKEQLSRVFQGTKHKTC